MGKAVGIYLGCLAVLVVLVNLSLGTRWLPGALVLMAYLGMGALLNRVVLRGLIEWHPLCSTLHNVASAKLRAFLFWPVQYAILFFQLTVDRVL